MIKLEICTISTSMQDCFECARNERGFLKSLRWKFLTVVMVRWLCRDAKSYIWRKLMNSLDKFITSPWMWFIVDKSLKFQILTQNKHLKQLPNNTARCGKMLFLIVEENIWIWYEVWFADYVYSWVLVYFTWQKVSSVIQCI